MKTGFKLYEYASSVDYGVINFSETEDIHKYLMKKHNIVSTFSFIKQGSLC